MLLKCICSFVTYIYIYLLWLVCFWIFVLPKMCAFRMRESGFCNIFISEKNFYTLCSLMIGCLHCWVYLRYQGYGCSRVFMQMQLYAFPGDQPYPLYTANERITNILRKIIITPTFSPFLAYRVYSTLV